MSDNAYKVVKSRGWRTPHELGEFYLRTFGAGEINNKAERIEARKES